MDDRHPYRDPRHFDRLLSRIHDLPLSSPVRIMEVCGTHTVAIARAGIRGLIPSRIRLLSGPGCPVCVTPVEEIDRAIDLARRPEIILATFGDLLRVPGTDSSLLEERTRGGAVRIVYSPMDVLKMAQAHPDKKVVFFAVGFETTAPAIAATVKRTRETGIRNLFFLSALRLLCPALVRLAQDPAVLLDGLLCPGHVASVSGIRCYAMLATRYRIPCVVAGFEPVDLLQGLFLLLEQHVRGEAEVQNQYLRAVRPEGNLRALAVMNEVFRPEDARWRGLGYIPESGLRLGGPYAELDAAPLAPRGPSSSGEPEGCLCGEVLRGVAEPPACPHFGKACRPDKPVGPCMVSSEGTCRAFYKYEQTRGTQET